MTDGRPVIVLVVEDNALVRRLVCQVMRLDGHEAIEAGSIAEAREVIGADVMVSDYSLPDGTAFDLARHWPAGLVIVTGHAAGALDPVGGLALLPKPFSGRVLQTAVRAVAEFVQYGGDERLAAIEAARALIPLERTERATPWQTPPPPGGNA